MKETGLNIWGKTGCELPNGNLCIACCVLPDIELEGNYVSVGKPSNSPCPFLDNGCSLHLKGKPDACKAWHCSMADQKGKLDLIAQGLSLNIVSQTEAISSASKVLESGVAKNMDKEYVIREKVIKRAGVLTNITFPKDLIIRDLNET